MHMGPMHWSNIARITHVIGRAWGKERKYPWIRGACKLLGANFFNGKFSITFLVLLLEEVLRTYPILFQKAAKRRQIKEEGYKKYSQISFKVRDHYTFDYAPNHHIHLSPIVLLIVELTKALPSCSCRVSELPRSPFGRKRRKYISSCSRTRSPKLFILEEDLWQIRRNWANIYPWANKHTITKSNLVRNKE